MHLIATGVLGWSKYERQSKEYGFIGIEKDGYNKAKCEKPFFDETTIKSLVGQRVRLIAVVTETRDSEHVGDMFLFFPGTEDHVKPTRPNVGDKIEIGVGVLQIKRDDQFENTMFGVDSTGKKFQMDPVALYKLHDQTVNVFIEKTDDPVSPPTRLIWEKGDKIGRGAGDNYIQMNMVVDENDTIKITPKTESLGGGCFAFHPPTGEVGEKLEVTVKKGKS